MKVVVLLSGGLDSSSAAYVLKNKGHEVHALSFNYGNRAQVELDCAKTIASKVCESHEIIEVKELQKIWSNPDGSKPKEAPYRNNILLTMAAAYANVNGFDAVALGNHADDYLLDGHTVFEDCKPEAVSVTRDMILMSDKKEIKVFQPFVRTTKADLIKKAIECGMDPNDTLSCYKPDEDGNECMECESCILKQKALKEIGWSK